jgi:hypothetical protein
LKLAHIKTIYSFLVAAVVLGACASRPSDWRPLSLRLKQGMTESQAIAAIGYKPNTIETVTCGGERGPGWECRLLHFESSGTDSPHPLTVYEAHSYGVWRVDSWNVL